MNLNLTIFKSFFPRQNQRPLKPASLESPLAANTRLFMRYNSYSTYQSHINMQNTKLGCCPNLEKCDTLEAMTRYHSTPFHVKPILY